MKVVVVLPVPERPTISPTLRPGGRRDDLAAGVQREPAAVVDELVPHAQAALLRLAEVVRVEDARHALLEVDRDQAVVGIALGLQVRRVDDGQLRFVLSLGGSEVELLLHGGDVRVRGLDVEPCGRAEVRVVPDEAVDHDHVLIGDVRVLRLGPLVAFLARDRLVLPVGLVGDDVRRALRAGDDLGLDVQVPVPRRLRVRHLRRELFDLGRGRVLDHVGRLGQPEQHLRHGAILPRRPGIPPCERLSRSLAAGEPAVTSPFARAPSVGAKGGDPHAHQALHSRRQRRHGGPYGEFPGRRRPLRGPTSGLTGPTQDHEELRTELFVSFVYATVSSLSIARAASAETRLPLRSNKRRPSSTRSAASAGRSASRSTSARSSRTAP